MVATEDSDPKDIISPRFQWMFELVCNYIFKIVLE